MNTRKLSAIAVIGVTGLLLAACTSGGGDSEAADADYIDGATVRVALSGAPGSLSPLTQSGLAAHIINAYSYDTVVATNADGEVVSNLADTWEFDGTVASFHIIEGITCSDGSDLTPTVIANNFEWHKNTENGSAKLGAAFGGSTDFEVEADDDASTVVVTLGSTNSAFLYQLQFLPIVCQAGLDDPESLATTTIGTGPYVVTSVDQDVSYTFEAREGYTWGADGVTSADAGFPAELEVSIVTDSSTRANMLISDEVDLIQVVNADDIERLTAQDYNTASGFIGGSAGQLWLNHNSGHATSSDEFRIALAQGVNWDDVMNVLTGGQGTRPNGLAQNTPTVCSENPSVTESEPGYDVDAANAILDELGYTKGSDGVRTNPDGSALTLTLLTTAATAAQTSATELVTSSLSENLGITVTAEASEYAALYERLTTTDSWDLGWSAWGYGMPSQYRGFFVPGSSLNFAGIDNAEYTELASEALASVGDDTCELWGEAEAALWSNADIISVARYSQIVFGSGATSDAIMSPESIRAVAK
ncbi:MAG: ABC transporter substrate-binding protein [Protaetiibacter sp.]